MGKIRVLHCIETVYSGGVEKRRLELAKYFHDKNFTLKIICTWAGGPILKEFTSLGIDLIQIGGFSHPFEILKHKKVLSVIKKFKPHIIHGAIFEGMTMAAINGNLGRVPIIILEETSDPQNRKNRANFLLRQFSRFSDKIIAISPEVKKYLNQTAKIPLDKIELINNGIQTPEFSKEEEITKKLDDLGLSDSVVIGFVGRLYNDHKRLSDLIEAISIIKNKNVKLLIVGDGRDKDLILEKIRKYAIEDKVVMVGFQQDTSLYYSMMNIFCIPSSREGFGLVAAEAMMHRLPVLATKVGGLADIVVDGETGFLVPPFNPGVIAEKLDVLIENPALRTQLGKAGFTRAMKSFTSERYCKEIEKLYIALLMDKGIALV